MGTYFCGSLGNPRKFHATREWKFSSYNLDPVVQKVAHYPVDKSSQNPLYYPLDGDLSGG